RATSIPPRAVGAGGGERGGAAVEGASAGGVRGAFARPPCERSADGAHARSASATHAATTATHRLMSRKYYDEGVRCGGCGGEVDVSGVFPGARVPCPGCGAPVEVIAPREAGTSAPY